MFKRKTLNVDVDVNAKINTVEVQDRVCFDLRTANGTYSASGDDKGVKLERVSSTKTMRDQYITGYERITEIHFEDLLIPVEHLDAVIGLLAAARDKYNSAPEVTPEVVE